MILLLMIWRNIVRHKLRTLLTFSTVFFGAILTLLYLAGRTSLEEVLDGSVMRGTMLVKSRYGAPIVSSLPNSHVDEILKVEGVGAATPICEIMSHSTKDNLPIADIIGVDPAGFKKIAGRDLASLSTSAWEEFERDPDALLLSRGVAVVQGFRVGDRVELPLRPGPSMMFYRDYKLPKDAKFGGRFVGVIEHGVFSDQVIIAHRDRLERLLGWKRGVGVLVQPAAGADAEAVSRSIEGHFDGTGLEEVEVIMLDLWAEGLRTLVDQLGAAFLFVIALVGLISVVIMVFNVSMSGLDLLPQVATMRALGMGRGGALFMMGGEGLLVSLAAALSAILLVYGTAALSGAIDLKKIDMIMGPRFILTPSVVGVVLGFALVLGAIGSIAPASRAARSSIAVLRRR